jgi:c-di-GMP-binding flagellar brake protein YcgR
MNQRKHPRFSVEYSAAFSSDSTSAQGLILNISSLGCKARSMTAVEKGDFMGLLIDIPTHETPLQVALAVVRWVRQQEFGLEFIRIEPKDQERLRLLLTDAESRGKQMPTAISRG